MFLIIIFNSVFNYLSKINLCDFLQYYFHSECDIKYDFILMNVFYHCILITLIFTLGIQFHHPFLSLSSSIPSSNWRQIRKCFILTGDLLCIHSNMQMYIYTYSSYISIIQLAQVNSQACPCPQNLIFSFSSIYSIFKSLMVTIS